MLAAAPVLTGTITQGGTGATLGTTLTPTLDVTELNGGILDARAVTLLVQNNTSEAITSLVVQLTDPTIPIPPITYTVPMAAALAAGQPGSYYVPLVGQGIASMMGVSATFAAAPSSGATVSVKAIVQTAGAAVAGAGSALTYDNQVSVTTTAAPLPSQQCVRAILTADPTNASGSYVYVGSATGQHTPLAPGQSATVGPANLAQIYAKASSGTLLLDIYAE